MSIILANLRKSCWDRETLTIAGGQFTDREVKAFVCYVLALKNALAKADPAAAAEVERNHCNS